MAKQAIRAGAHREPKAELAEPFRRLNLHPFENEKGDRAHPKPEPLPDPQQGYEYIACDVGGDREGGRGVRRFIFECHKVQNMWGAVFYTEAHYEKFTFYLLEER